MLRTEKINYSIGKKKILQDITVDFLPGEFNMILGPNGSGKSTFLKIFSGEINDFSGSVLYADKKIGTKSALPSSIGLRIAAPVKRDTEKN